MRAHQPEALAIGSVVLAVALGVTGCEPTTHGTTTGTGAAAAKEGHQAGSRFSTVRFLLDSRGGVQVTGGSRAAVRQAGAYPVSVGRTHDFGRPRDRVLVVLRHWPESADERAARGRTRRQPPPEEPVVESGFLVDTAGWTRADLDGHPLQWLRREDTIRIDTTNSAAGDEIRFTLSGPHGGRPGQPPRQNDCANRDPSVPRRLPLPDVEPGDPVPDVLARLRARCLDVQYASAPGTTPPGTVERVLIPLAGRPVTSVAVPPLDGTTDNRSGEGPEVTGGANEVSADLSRPATLVVSR